MKRIATIAFAVSAALASGAVLAQDKAATANAAAKSTQAATPGSASAGSAAAGQSAGAVGAVQGFGNAVITAIPHIGIAAGMTAVGSAANDQGGGSTTQH